MKPTRYERGIWQLLRDDRGAAAVECGLLVSLVSLATIAAYHHFGNTLSGMLDDIAMIVETINGLMTEGHDFAG